MQSILRLLSVCVSGGFLLACSSNETSTTTPDAVTLIAIDPTDFPSQSDPAGSQANAPACGSPVGSGAYVAELIDVSHVVNLDTLQKIPDFPAQSSPPTACNRTVAFGRVVPFRQYIARVSTYADTDGDPSTIDVRTLDGTSVTVMRENTTQLAKPLTRFTCFGWQKDPKSATEASPGTEGAVETTSQAQSACEGTGCPGMALEYRTMLLHYCVTGVD